MRIEREKRTIVKMIAMYCKAKHEPNGELCQSCSALRQYALERVTRCKFGEAKPVCAKCPIHCYKPSMRQEIRNVMRYAGPRMLFSHPIAAIRHLIDSLRSSNSQ